MSTATATASSSKRGRFFYELITVKVEDKSYQIRKDRLERTSQYFQRIFSSLKDGGTNEGSKENPLELRGCTKAEFETLLSFLTSQTALSGPPEFDKEQWIAILKLGTLWSMHLVRTKALAHLESSGLDSKEKATIGMQYGVSQFFIEGSTDLAKGGFEASDIDNLGDSMGYATLARLLLVRSMARETNVALPLDKLKCLQCSATLVSKQSNSTVQDASPRLGSMSRAEPSHSSPLYGIGESGTAASPWSSYARYQPPVPQSTAQQYQYDPQGAHYSAPQASTSPQPLYGSGTPSSVPQSTSWASSTSIQTPKSSITLTLSCPTAACRGVPSANSVSVDAIELRVRIDVEDTIRQVFAEEVGGMS